MFLLEIKNILTKIPNFPKFFILKDEKQRDVVIYCLHFYYVLEILHKMGCLNNSGKCVILDRCLLFGYLNKILHPLEFKKKEEVNNDIPNGVYFI